MRRLFATVGAFGLAAGVTFGGPEPTSPVSAPTPPTASSPVELVTRLGADDFRTREAAVAALERSGPAALPALRAALTSDDPEIRLRVAPILHKLQRAADSAVKLAPAKIALDYKNLSLGTAVNDLKARTGLNLTFDTAHVADPLRKITCVTGELTTWEALDAFCAAAGLKERFQQELEVPKVQVVGRRGYTPPPQVPNADAVPIVLVDGTAPRMPGDRRTAVRVVALPAAFPGHRVTLGTGGTTLCLDVTPAPGLNWQEVMAVKITKLIDDAGRPGGAGSARPGAEGGEEAEVGVVAFGGPGMRFAGPIGGARFDLRTGAPIYPETVANPRVVAVPLKLGTPTARSVKRMEGLVLGEIVLPNQTLIAVTDPAKNVGTAFDGAGQIRMTVVGVTETKTGGAAVQLLLEYPSPWSVAARRGANPGGIWPEAPRQANQMPTVQSFDAAGKAIPAAVAGNFTNASDDGLMLHQHMTLSFRKGTAAPSKLVVVGPRPMVVEVPFVMENVPLP